MRESPSTTKLDRRFNRHVPWYQVLKILGHEPQVAALPVTVGCPLCQHQTLEIHAYSRKGGGWHYCRNCRSTGDMIELAAKCWKIDLTAAIQRLVASGVGIPTHLLLPENIDSYDRRMRRRNELPQFMQRAALTAKQADATDQVRLLEALQVEEHRTSANWIDRGGRFVGMAHCSELDKIIRNTANVDDGADKQFLGWSHIAVAPFHDLPGRISGFLCIGRKGRRDKDWIFVPTRIVDQRKQNLIETGLACYEALLGPNVKGPFDDTKFIGPAEEVLPLQTKHYLDSTLPLPAAGFWTGKQKIRGQWTQCVCWDTCQRLMGNDLVLWDKAPSAELFNMAARCHGRVVLTAHRSAMKRLNTPTFRLAYYNREARPWQIVLYEVMNKADVRLRDEILTGLRLDEHQIRDLYNNANQAQRKLLRRNLNRESIASTAVLGKHRVLCTPDGWILEPGGKQIVDACLYIDQTVFRTDTRETYYRGRIVHQEQTYHFTEKSREVEAGTLRWMRDHVLAAGGPLIHYQHNYSKSIVQIALQFRPPERVEGVGRAGWCESSQSLLLPNFELPLGARARQREHTLLDQFSPARQIKWNSDRVVSSALFTSTPECRLFWATVATLTANIFSPAWSREESGLGLAGLGAILVGRLAAKSLGCHSFDIPLTNSDQSALEQLDRAVSAHRWPIILNPPRNSHAQRGLATWLRTPSPKPIVSEMDRRLVAGLKIHPGWRFILCDEPITSTENIQREGTVAAFSWLEYLSLQRLELPGTSDDLMSSRILSVMQQWAKSLDYPNEVFEAAEELIDEQSGPLDLATHFVSTVFRLLAEKKIRIACTDFAEHPWTTCIVPDENMLGHNVFVPKRAIHDCLLNEGTPTWDAAELLEALRDAGALIDEITHNGVNGWLLSRPWWDSQYKLYEARQERLLRLVG